MQSRIRLHARKPPSRTTQQPACAEPLPTYPNPRNACRKFHRNLRGVRGPMTTNQTRPAHCVQNMVPRRSGSSWPIPTFVHLAAIALPAVFALSCFRDPNSPHFIRITNPSKLVFLARNSAGIQFRVVRVFRGQLPQILAWPSVHPIHPWFIRPLDSPFPRLLASWLPN